MLAYDSSKMKLNEVFGKAETRKLKCSQQLEKHTKGVNRELLKGLGPQQIDPQFCVSGSTR